MGNSKCVLSLLTPEQVRENAIVENKELRVELDSILQKVETSPHESRERSIVITKLQEAIMWLGMDLKELGNENHYPNSYNPNNTIVDNNTNFRETAVKLWDLLDDIDTACDMFKPRDEESAMAYYRYVSEKTIDRHRYLKSNGYELYTLAEFEQLPQDKRGC